MLDLDHLEALERAATHLVDLVRRLRIEAAHPRPAEPAADLLRSLDALSDDLARVLITPDGDPADRVNEDGMRRLQRAHATLDSIIATVRAR